ncbi:hypothetical protein GQX74_011807 [Glossina fuscipes]|nr:hypothetical protein GQX74_011807 [Glossina fuscipes]
MKSTSVLNKQYPTLQDSLYFNHLILLQNNQVVAQPLTLMLTVQVCYKAKMAPTHLLEKSKIALANIISKKFSFALCLNARRSENIRVYAYYWILGKMYSCFPLIILQDKFYSNSTQCMRSAGYAARLNLMVLNPNSPLSSKKEVATFCNVMAESAACKQ